MGRKWAGGGHLPLSGPADFEVKPGSLRRNAQQTGGDPEQGLGSQLKTRTLKEGLENIGGKESQQHAHIQGWSSGEVYSQAERKYPGHPGGDVCRGHQGLV